MIDILVTIGYSYMLAVLTKYIYLTWVMGMDKDDVLSSLNGE